MSIKSKTTAKLSKKSRNKLRSIRFFDGVLCEVSVFTVTIWLFLRSTALLLHAHKNTVFYRYNIIEAGKTVADV